MQKSVLITLDGPSLEALIFDAVDRAFKLNPGTISPSYTPLSQQVDFNQMCLEYFPGIPDSTIRQQTADLARTKIGKRVLFDRLEIQEFLKSKRQASSEELEHLVEESFCRIVAKERKGGRRAKADVRP